jgi:hypothetical protein
MRASARRAWTTWPGTAPHSIYDPPEYLTVDVDRTISEGRVIAASTFAE